MGHAPKLVQRSPLGHSPTRLDELPAFLDRMPPETVLHYAVAFIAKAGGDIEIIEAVQAIVDAARQVVAKGTVIRTPREYSIDVWAPSTPYNLTLDSACDVIAEKLIVGESMRPDQLAIELKTVAPSGATLMRLASVDLYGSGRGGLGYDGIREAVKRHPLLEWVHEMGVNANPPTIVRLPNPKGSHP